MRYTLYMLHSIHFTIFQEQVRSNRLRAAGVRLCEPQASNECPVNGQHAPQACGNQTASLQRPSCLMGTHSAGNPIGCSDTVLPEEAVGVSFMFLPCLALLQCNAPLAKSAVGS